LESADLDLAVPGEHNRKNAAASLAALELAGVDRQQAAKHLSEFAGAGRRLELHGEAGGGRVLRDHPHPPAEIRAPTEAVRDGGRVLVLFQPHLYSRTRHLVRELAAALAHADVAAVTEIYGAREEPVQGVSGKLVVDAMTETRPGMTVGWTPNVEEGAPFPPRRARAGGASP